VCCAPEDGSGIEVHADLLDEELFVPEEYVLTRCSGGGGGGGTPPV